MTQALFSSRDGGHELQAAVIDLFALARDLAAMPGFRVEVQVMAFAFTDAAISESLILAARACPNLTVRLIADWSQSARGAASVLRNLDELRLPNLFVKFKLDVPYRRDPATGYLSYSYGASLGMLHHKTLLIRVDDRPVAMALGSFNWSARGRTAYENLLVVGDALQDAAVLADFEAEFQGLWSDHRLTATSGRCASIMTRIKAEAKAGRDPRSPALLVDILGVAGEVATPRGPRREVDGPVLTAFSGALPGGSPQAGHAASLDRRAIDLLRPAGTRRPAPLTLNALALEAIRSVPSGATLKVAMYALSPRVPEYADLLAAARRGVRLEVLLDATIGGPMGRALTALAKAEGLPLAVCLSRRRMHQKYLCCPQTGMVLTGTANMTEDATLRHSDHRILFRSDAALCAEFCADFDLIWARLRSLDLPRADIVA